MRVSWEESKESSEIKANWTAEGRTVNGKTTREDKDEVEGKKYKGIKDNDDKGR